VELIEGTELLSARVNDVVNVYITCGNNSWENPLFPSLIKDKILEDSPYEENLE